MRNYFEKNKFIITGGDGFLGKHVVNYFIKNNVPQENIYVPKSSNYDLRNEDDVKKLLKKNYIIIHLASNVGGLGKGLNKDADYFYDNAIMSLNLFKIGRDVGVKKIVGIGTILQYPDDISIPFKEKQIFDGYPSDLTDPYASGKNIMVKASNFFRSQYNFNSMVLILPNLYGPGDDFNPKSSHVVPSLIFKVNKAKIHNQNSIKVWGDGKSSRDFLYVKDAAEGIFLATKFGKNLNLLNIGSGKITTIKDLTEKICKLMNFNGKIVWEVKKEINNKNNQLDISLAKKNINFVSKTKLIDGLKETINSYLKN